MALREHLPPPPKGPGTPCSVGAALAAMDETDRATLLEWLGTPERRGLTAGQIFEALTSAGYPVKLQTINRHRARHCRCPR